MITILHGFAVVRINVIKGFLHTNMSVSTDISLIDILFDRDDPVLKFAEDKDVFKQEFDVLDSKTDLLNEKVNVVTYFCYYSLFRSHLGGKVDGVAKCISNPK